MCKIIPDMDWYAGLSQERGVQPRCPFATVKACPRFYQSLSLLGEAKHSTSMDAKEDERLLGYWKKSDLWQQTHEQASSYFGREGHYSFSKFCPEVSYDRFGYFASGLYRYADELDTDLAHEHLEKEKASANDPRWAWEAVSPLHYTECPLYSVLAHRSKHAESNTRVDKIIERIKNHPIVAVLIVLGIIVIALASLTDSIDRLIRFFSRTPSSITNVNVAHPSPDSGMHIEQKSGGSASPNIIGNNNQVNIDLVPPKVEASLSQEKPRESPIEVRPQTVRELFAADFANLKAGDINISVALEDGVRREVKARFYLNFPEKVRFVGFFVPASDRTYEICTTLPDRTQPAWDELRKGFFVKAGDTGGSNSMDDLIFSGRVFLYHEYPLTIKEKAALIDLYTSRKLDVQFRGIEYLESSRKVNAQYDVSVSMSGSVSMDAAASTTNTTDVPEKSPAPEK